MILSHASDTAIRALTELVIRNGVASTESVTTAGHDRPVDCKGLCRDAGLSFEYVAKLFHRLVKADILSSAKGPGGGYALTKSARQISLLSIVQGVNADEQIDWCAVRWARCNERKPCRQHNVFKAVRQCLRNHLQATTLADMAATLEETRMRDPGATDALRSQP